MSDITPLQKAIYNQWLYKWRTIQRKPFRSRQDFANLDPQTHSHLQKLEQFFCRYPKIEIAKYFEAPYQLFENDDTAYSLEFYATMRGMRCFNLLKDKLWAMPPDSKFQLEMIAQSFKWIYAWCVQQDVPPQHYTDSHKKAIAPFIQHIKARDVSIYAALAFPNGASTIDALQPDIHAIMLKNLDLRHCISLLDRSKYAKKMAERAYQTICTKWVVKPV